MLLFGRVIQGIGASMTMATNTGITTEVFPMSERGRALGAIGAFVSLGSIAGPGIGGLILAHFSWSYIFWINVPVGILTILIGEKFLPNDITMSKKKIDWLGFVTFAITIMSFFGSVFIGQEVGYLQIAPISLLIIAVVFFAAFIRVEKKKADPLLVFSILKNKMFTMSLITALLIFSANFFVNVVMPFYLQNARGLTASYAGLLMMVFPFLMVIGSPLSGYLTDQVGPQKLVLIGLAMLSVTQLMYIFMDQTSPIWYYVLAIMGMGNALFQSPNNTIVMSSVEKENLGVAGSMNSFARNLGMVIGIALSTTILYSGMSASYGQRVTTYVASRPDIFIFGMRVTFIASLVICIIALLLSFSRFRKKAVDETVY